MYAMEEKTKGAGNPIKEAIAKIAKLLDGAEVGLMKNRGKPPAKVEVEIEAGGHAEPDGDECAECLAGECDNPEHLKDEDVEGLASMLGATSDESKY